jgi:hypothetical protein
MQATLRRRVRQLICILAVVALYIADFGKVDLAAASATVAKASAGEFIDNCHEGCGPEASCEEQCWASAPELPAFLTTCGEYGGSPWNGVGQCLGFCGDGYCNEYNEEDDESCYDDCGECGDNICNGPEDLAMCPQDCRSCGDDMCTGPWENCTTCAVDCNPTFGTCGPGTDPGDECDEGKVENGAGFCCEIEYLVEGLEGCLGCGANEQCFYTVGGGGSWACVGIGETCGD